MHPHPTLLVKGVDQQSGAMSSEEVHMQVDEPATTGELTTPKKPPRVSLPEVTFQELCILLGAQVPPASSDDDIGRRLGVIWFVVNNALLMDKSLHPHLANQEQYRKNLDKIGQLSFVNSVKDIARRKSWQELVQHGTYFLRLISSTLIVACVQGCFSRNQNHGGA